MHISVCIVNVEWNKFDLPNCGDPPYLRSGFEHPTLSLRLRKCVGQSFSTAPLCCRVRCARAEQIQKYKKKFRIQYWNTNCIEENIPVQNVADLEDKSAKYCGRAQTRMAALSVNRDCFLTEFWAAKFHKCIHPQHQHFHISSIFHRQCTDPPLQCIYLTSTS